VVVVAGLVRADHTVGVGGDVYPSISLLPVVAVVAATAPVLLCTCIVDL
jgi:hypothetical protein